MSGETLTILHFNDVYSVEGNDKEPVGGAARLSGLVKAHADRNPLVLFSGDCFNPSMMSTVTKGKHMVPILNEIGVAASVVGNHDLDFGVENFIRLSGQCSFPWLLANIHDKKTGHILGDALPTTVLDWHGWTVGLVGLAEEEWLATLATIDMEQLDYTDFVEEGRKRALELREAGVDVVVALTHMRAPNDMRLLEEVPEIDVVLGGHDHDYLVQHVQPHGNLLVKSGTDFRDLTLVEIQRAESRPLQTKWSRLSVTSQAPIDPVVAKVVEQYQGVMGAKMGKVIGRTLSELDGRFCAVRRGETNLGNLVCDIWQKATGAEAVLLNSGSLRSDMLHSAGPLKVQDLVAILPMLDTTGVLACSGRDLVTALENGVSQYPKLEGRFPQVAGIRFSFDPSFPAGQRVVPGSVEVAGAPLDQERIYRVATKGYMAAGRDGYDVFAGCKVVVDPEVGVLLPTIIRNHFRALQVLGGLKRKDAVQRTAHHWLRIARRRSRSRLVAGAVAEEEAVETGSCVLDPVTLEYSVNPRREGRIVCVGGGSAAAAI